MRSQTFDSISLFWYILNLFGKTLIQGNLVEAQKICVKRVQPSHSLHFDFFMTHQRNQTINQTKEHQHFTACIPDLRQHTVFVWLHLRISLFTPYVCVVGEVTWGNQGNNEPPPKTNHGARLNPHSSFPFHPAALVPLQEQRA